MALSLWSTDGFFCDLYVYASMFGGYDVHVAKTRRPRRVTGLFDGFSAGNCDVTILTANKRKQRAELADPTNQPKTIGGPNDGETIHCDTAEELLQIVSKLSENGYRVPDQLFANIVSEINS